MAPNESHDRVDEPAELDEPDVEWQGPITVATTDPAIESAFEHPSDWKIHSGSTVWVETTQVSEPNPLYFPGVRKSELGDQRKGAHGQGKGDDQRRSHGGDQDRGDGRNSRHDHHDGPQTKRQPSMIKNLSITAGVAMLCGVFARSATPTSSADVQRIFVETTRWQECFELAKGIGVSKQVRR